jgi:hypothetical protein
MTWTSPSMSFAPRCGMNEPARSALTSSAAHAAAAIPRTVNPVMAHFIRRLLS